MADPCEVETPEAAVEAAVEVMARAWWAEVGDGFVEWPEGEGASKWVREQMLKRAAAALRALIAQGWTPPGTSVETPEAAVEAVVAWERDGHVKSAAEMPIRDDGFGWPKGGPEAFGWTPLVRAQGWTPPGGTE